MKQERLAPKSSSLIQSNQVLQRRQPESVKIHSMDSVLQLQQALGNQGVKQLLTGRVQRREDLIRPVSGTLRQVLQRQSKPKMFDDYLEEGAVLFGTAQFGLSGGNQAGPDPADGYDAGDWVEDTQHRGVIRAKISPWDAIDHMVKNINKEVPKADGTKTRWSFDCFEFVKIIRIYAYWKTMAKDAFNQRFNPLELGFNTKSGLTWDPKIIRADKPGDRPFYYEGTVIDGVMDNPKQVFVNKTWTQLVAEAPIGTQIIWTNKDAVSRCGANPNLGFSNYMNENTTKLGPDRYAAHPFGIVNEDYIKRRMAQAVADVVSQGTIPPGYIENNIYISAIRYPVR
jgi:hypothetical protein